jgi:ketosteroid isomerase-like protein
MNPQTGGVLFLRAAVEEGLKMTEQQNVEAVRRIYQLTNDGDLISVLNMLSEDVELFLFGSSKVPWAGHWRGRQGAEQFLMAMGNAAEVKDITHHLVGTGDSVISIHRPTVRVRATGRDAYFNVVHVWTLRDGLIVRMREYADTAAWEAAFD